jgi:protein-disulfide isomerase
LDETSLVSYAHELGLDETTWEDCRASQAPRDQIEADRQLATDARVPATPTFFVNGDPLVGAYPIADLRDAVDSALDTAMSSGLLQEEYYESLMQRACE